MDHAIVLAGGSGLRFWPESRLRCSKQFLNLTGAGPMVKETVDRLRPLFPPERIWIVAGRKDASHLSPKALGIRKGNILLEPEGKNTAPAVSLAAAVIARNDPGAVMLVAPADHAIADVRKFLAVIRKGLRLAGKTNRFITLGIPPTHPSTGYGYIERGAPFPGKEKGAFHVARFAEKPDLATARRFLRSSRFDWNSGIFFFRGDTLAKSLAKFLPEVGEAIGKAVRGDKSGFERRLSAAYSRMQSISIDYGILEKEKGILVIPADMGWNDLGTWRSLHEFLTRGEGNVAFGNAILTHCQNTLARTDKGLVAALGVEDLVIVRSGDVVLVCPRSRSEDVKMMAEEVRKHFPDLA